MRFFCAPSRTEKFNDLQFEIIINKNLSHMRTTNFVCSILAAAIATTSMVTAVAVDQVQLIPTDLAQAEGAIQLEGG